MPEKNHSTPFEDDDDVLLAAMEDMALPSSELGACGLSMSEVTSEKGAIFEIKEQSEEERREEEEECLWWSREALLDHLEAGDEDHNPLTPFKEMMAEMEVICSSDDGEPAVYKKTVRKGSGPKVTEETSIKYHLNAYLDGVDEPFDSTTIRKRAFSHRLSSDSIVPGLYFGLLTMREGEKAYLIVEPQFAFGKLGCPPRIPGDASVLYVIQVIQVFQEGTIGDYFTLSPEEQHKKPFHEVLDMAEKERKSANGYFNEGKKKEASVRYRRGIKVLEERVLSGREEEKAAKGLLLKLYCNYANTSVALKRPLTAMTACRKALQMKPDHPKALYFYAVAKLDHGDYDEARSYLMRLKTLVPASQDLTRQLTRLEKLTEENRIQETLLYRNIGNKFFNKSS